MFSVPSVCLLIRKILFYFIIELERDDKNEASLDFATVPGCFTLRTLRTLYFYIYK